MPPFLAKSFDFDSSPPNSFFLICVTLEKLIPVLVKFLLVTSNYNFTFLFPSLPYLQFQDSYTRFNVKSFQVIVSVTQWTSLADRAIYPQPYANELRHGFGIYFGQ